jgi:uncharacterized protein YukE
MFELSAAAGVSVELEQARRQLRSIAGRVEDAARSAPRRDASGWDGPAAHAYQHALDQLGRELASGQELLRSATDLVGAALFELGGHA